MNPTARLALALATTLLAGCQAATEPTCNAELRAAGTLETGDTVYIAYCETVVSWYDATAGQATEQ